MPTLPTPITFSAASVGRKRSNKTLAQRSSVSVQECPAVLLQIGIDMKQKRWLVNDPDGALLMRHDLVADVLGRAALRPLDVLLDEPLQLRIALELLYDRCVAEAAIPHRHHRHTMHYTYHSGKRSLAKHAAARTKVKTKASS